MPFLPQHSHYRLTLAAITGLAIASLASNVSARTPGGQEILSPAEMARGTAMTQAQCARLQNAVWVQARGRDFCIRYYLSAVGGGGRRPVVFLDGDHFGRWDGNTQTFELPRTQPYSTAALQRYADALSRQTGTTAIRLARPGTDGSSGHHRYRRSLLEVEAVNAALEAIKRRHNFDGFHLVGQSGGAALIGGLLPLRRDIGCAVPGAGPLARITRPQTGPARPPQSDPALRQVNGLDSIPAIVRNSTARIMVVTDPQDTRVPYESQATFVQQLRAAGGSVEHYIIEATDERHHGATPYARQAVALCIRGAAPPEVSADLARMVAERLAARARAQGNPQNRPQATPQRPPHQPQIPPAGPAPGT